MMRQKVMRVAFKVNGIDYFPIRPMRTAKTLANIKVERNILGHHFHHFSWSVFIYGKITIQLNLPIFQLKHHFWGGFFFVDLTTLWTSPKFRREVGLRGGGADGVACLCTSEVGIPFKGSVFLKCGVNFSLPGFVFLGGWHRIPEVRCCKFLLVFVVVVVAMLLPISKQDVTCVTSMANPRCGSNCEGLIFFVFVQLNLCYFAHRLCGVFQKLTIYDYLTPWIRKWKKHQTNSD